MRMIRKLLTPDRGINRVVADLICSESNTLFNPQLPPQISLHVEGKGDHLSFPFFSLLREAE